MFYEPRKPINAYKSSREVQQITKTTLRAITKGIVDMSKRTKEEDTYFDENFNFPIPSLKFLFFIKIALNLKYIFLSVN